MTHYKVLVKVVYFLLKNKVLAILKFNFYVLMFLLSSEFGCHKKPQHCTLVFKPKTTQNAWVVVATFVWQGKYEA